MTFTFLIIMLLMINFLNPISLVMIIMTQTLWTAIMTNIQKDSFWYGYILILIFLGGMLILFSYICSLASNEIFHKMNLFSLTFIVITFFMISKIQMSYSSINESSYEMSTHLYNNDMFIMLLLIVYLMITLIIITKVTDYKQGPLRQTP